MTRDFFSLRQFALILKGVNYGKKLEENVKRRGR